MLGSSRSPGQVATLPIIYRESPVSAPPLRRTDKLIYNECTREFLVRGFYGRIASVGADGWPYCVPLPYVWADSEVHIHNPAARGHFRANDAESRPHHQRALPRGRRRRVDPALSAALRRAPPPGTCGRLSVAPQDRGRNICPARHPSARSPRATMGRKSRERRCVMAVAPLPHMSGQTHTSSESKSGTDLLKTSSVTLTSVHLLSCAV